MTGSTIKLNWQIFSIIDSNSIFYCFPYYFYFDSHYLTSKSFFILLAVNYNYTTCMTFSYSTVCFFLFGFFSLIMKGDNLFVNQSWDINILKS